MLKNIMYKVHRTKFDAHMDQFNFDVNSPQMENPWLVNRILPSSIRRFTFEYKLKKSFLGNIGLEE